MEHLINTPPIGAVVKNYPYSAYIINGKQFEIKDCGSKNVILDSADNERKIIPTFEFVFNVESGEYGVIH